MALSQADLERAETQSWKKEPAGGLEGLAREQRLQPGLQPGLDPNEILKSGELT